MFLIFFREDLFSRMEAKSFFHARNFREFLEKDREIAKIRENFSPRKFVPIKYIMAQNGSPRILKNDHWTLVSAHFFLFFWSRSKAAFIPRVVTYCNSWRVSSTDVLLKTGQDFGRWHCYTKKIQTSLHFYSLLKIFLASRSQRCMAAKKKRPGKKFD